jgi:hypothetical protein
MMTSCVIDSALTVDVAQTQIPTQVGSRDARRESNM